MAASCREVIAAVRERGEASGGYGTDGLRAAWTAASRWKRPRSSRMAEAAGADAVDVSAYANTSTGVAFTEAPLVQQEGRASCLGGGDQGRGEDPGDRRRAAGARSGRHRHQAPASATSWRWPASLADPELPRSSSRSRRKTSAVHLLLRLRQPDLGEPARQMCGEPAHRPRVETRLNPVEHAAHVVVVGGGRPAWRRRGSPRSAAAG